MIRLLLAILILLSIASTPAIAQDWLDNVDVVTPDPTPDPVPDAEPPVIITSPLEDRAIVSDVVRTAVEGIRADVASLREAVVALNSKLDDANPVAMPMPQQCECKCDCPALDEIRTVVREELARVTVTLKSASGETKRVQLPLVTPSKAATRPLTVPSDGGWYVTAIDGVACSPKPVTTAYGPATSYETPNHEVRVMQFGSGLIGAARSTCRIVNGKKTCN